MLRYRDIRVIGPEGEQLGVMQSRHALAMAKEQGLDLVMVAQAAQPPVCKIIDHGKFKYEQEKRDKENKRKAQDVKGIKLRPNIAENDLNTLVRHARKFLEEGDKVRAVCQFRAREIVHPQNGYRKMDMLLEKLNDIAVVEKPAALDGKLMIMVLAPKPNQQGTKKKDAENQDQQDGGQEIQDHGDGKDNPPEERE